ncbi:MAG TPA: TolC family protein [Blastocatellia bacterium]|nr:TolC family protein [Blastocatellia bacterium]
MNNCITSGLGWRLASALLLAALSASATMAQPAQPRRLTLAEAVERARQYHPHIIAAKQRVAIAEAERLESGLRSNPSLTVSGENFPIGPTQKGFDFGSDTDWFAVYTQTFETAGKRRLRISSAEHNLEAAQSEASAVERRVVYEVKATYQRVANARLRLELLRENHNNLNQLAGMNEIRVKEGYTAEGDLIKARLEVKRVEFQSRKINLEYERSRIELLRAMGASSFEDGDLSFDVTEEPDYQPATLDMPSLREAAMRLPQMQVAQARVERAESLLRLEHARVRPDITASFGYKRNGSENALFAAVSAPLPFHNRNQAQIARAQAEVEAARAELRYAQSTVLAELAAARRAVELNQKQVESLRAEFLSLADESRSVSLAAYREGAVDLLVLLDAQRVRIQAQEFYFQALYEYQLAVHDLERAAGIEQLPARQNAGQRAYGK